MTTIKELCDSVAESVRWDKFAKACNGYITAFVSDSLQGDQNDMNEVRIKLHEYLDIYLDSIQKAAKDESKKPSQSKSRRSGDNSFKS